MVLPIIWLISFSLFKMLPFVFHAPTLNVESAIKGKGFPAWHFGHLVAIADPFYQVWLEGIKEWGSKSTYWFSPASLFLASSTSGRLGSASFYLSQI
jgi:hypothetical protein